VLPLADAAAIAFVLPLFVAALAVPMLNERLDGARLVAITIGFAGALLVVRPGSSVFTLYALLPWRWRSATRCMNPHPQDCGVEHP
jgi:drug/metabolite transporter (DMT)-like permease